MDKKKILHFEGVMDIAAMYEISFREIGFEYKHYLSPPKSADKLIDLVVKEKPDLIIMEILAPDVIHIFEAAKVLSSAPQTQNIPIFGMSNIGFDMIKKEVDESGMVDFFCSSDMTPREMLKIIEEYFEDPLGYKARYKTMKS